MAEVTKKEVDGIVGPVEQKPPKIRTREEALNYMESILVDVQRKRQACNVQVPNNPEATVSLQRQRFWVYLMTVGRALQAPADFYSMGLVDELAWREFHQKALNTLAANVVGSL